jgi:hypothetical protein
MKYREWITGWATRGGPDVVEINSDIRNNRIKKQRRRVGMDERNERRRDAIDILGEGR